MGNMSETVLIVDDSKLQRTILRGMLEKSFRVIEAANGEECIDIVEHSHGKIDLILLDLVMPGADGFAVLKKRQRSEEFLDIPVIVLTMSETEADQLKTFELGANEFILKPIQEEIALFRIHNVLNAKRRVSTLRKEQEKLRAISEMDEMTKLYNKVTAQNMAQSLLSGHPCAQHALLMIDVDNFKAINDIHGHKMGDHTICVIANVLAAVFRQEDIVGRIGGDEFMVFMPELSSKDIAWAKAEEIIRVMCEKENLSIPDEVTVSIGLAFSEGKEITFEQLFVNADEALYCSKKDGKGRVTGDGITGDTELPRKTVLVCSKSRSLASMMEYAVGKVLRIQSVTSWEELTDYLRDYVEPIDIVYVDVSCRSDAAADTWGFLKERGELQGVLVVAVCEEGNMEQLKAAVLSGCVSDIMLAPLEAETLKRRVRKHMERL